MQWLAVTPLGGMAHAGPRWDSHLQHLQHFLCIYQVDIPTHLGKHYQWIIFSSTANRFEAHTHSKAACSDPVYTRTVPMVCFMQWTRRMSVFWCMMHLSGPLISQVMGATLRMSAKQNPQYSCVLAVYVGSCLFIYIFKVLEKCQPLFHNDLYRVCIQHLSQGYACAFFYNNRATK